MPTSPRPRAIRVHLLVFAGSTPIVPVGLFDLLRKAGDLALSMQRDAPHVEVALVAASKRRTLRAAADLPIACHFTLADAPPPSLVVVSPADPEVLDRVSRDPDTTRYLRRAYARGADLASVCTGAFTLAETGLLDGREAATHWAFQELFQERFPRVRLRPQEILIDGGRVLSTGGATSFLSFAVYLIERFYGEEVARACASMFLIDQRKSPQGAYAVFAGQKQHGDEAILRAQTMMEQTLSEAVAIEDIATKVAMSRRTFIRRFKDATHSTPREYLQRARIEAAKRLLEGTRHTVADVASRVGYGDLAAFRRLFSRHTGLSPTEYRGRYGTLRSGAKASVRRARAG